MQHCLQRRNGLAKHSHHGITNRFDQRAILLSNHLLQHIEVAHHVTERGCVTNLSVHARRILQISEEYRECADRDLLAGPQSFSGKQIAKDLKRGDFSGCCSVVAPLGALKNK